LHKSKKKNELHVELFKNPDAVKELKFMDFIFHGLYIKRYLRVFLFIYLI